MWLFTKYGFYSIVTRDGYDAQYQVRARVKRDLENLLEVTQLSTPIIELGPERDYPYRIYVNRKERALVFELLGATIDYSNFKDRIHERRDQANKNSAYMQIWSILRNALQPVKRRGRQTESLWDSTQADGEAEIRDYLNRIDAGEPVK